MALPDSSLARACRAIAAFVAERLEASQNNVHVLVGPPAAAVPRETDTQHRVNLFFYRLEPSGFGPAADPDEVWRLRLSCLVTAFGVPEDQITAGENDLRLLGRVLAAFHERPLLDEIDVDGEPLRAQVLFQPLSIDEINHLWATQGEVSYRPSVAYEVALVPVPPARRRVEGPRVGALGLDVRASRDGRRAPFGGTPRGPAVPRTAVAVERADWSPRIAFVVDGECREAVALALEGDDLAAFTPPRVWVAGEPGAEVELAWEVWDREQGWRPAAGDPQAAVASSAVLDPAAAAEADTVEVALPFDDRAGQAMLHARRRFVRPGDGVEVTLRSNPLLVTLYEEAP